MKRIKIGIKKLKTMIQKTIKRIKTEQLIEKYMKDNVLFIMFVITGVLNASLLRILCMPTVESIFSIQAFLADFAVVTIIGSFAYFLKPKHRFIYYICFNIFLTAICMINSVYYTYYTSFASISMLSLTQYVGEVGDAVTENVIQLKDLIYIIGPIVMLVVNRKLKKQNYYKRIEVKSERKKKAFVTLITGACVAGVFLLTLTPTDISRLLKQWNKEYIVQCFGIYVYQGNDVISTIQPTINSMFGYDKAYKNFTEYFEGKETVHTNEYTNIFEGKNVLVIHAESMQTNPMYLQFNGQEVTPNLNHLARQGMFFSNYYSQVSVGTSSDAELTFNTSLMPTKSGTAFVSYPERTYISTPSMLKEKGYYTFSMHANNGDFWNRRVMHQSLGYDKFYSKSEYEIADENIIGLGLNDKEFFTQSVEKLKKIDSKHEKWYGLMIMLSNHTPFSDTDKYGEFPVDIKETITNPDGTTEEVVYPYLEGTKLGNYYKSLHYADSALGVLIEELDKANLLEDTVLVIYGDHDARISKKEYNYQQNYDKEEDDLLDRDDENYVEFDSYQQELGRKVPFIIWTKDMAGTNLNQEISNVMGMYDAMPTLGNMLGFYNEYALGHDIFNIKDQNIVVFPNGNWLTNKVYYNSQKGEHLSLVNEAISEEEIKNNNEYATKLLDVSNDIIVFDLLKPKDIEPEEEKGE